MNQEREIPYDFILDYLLRIEITVKPFFGMFSIYNGQKLLLMLRHRKDQPELNGIWVPTDRDSLESLKTELPSLRQIYGLGNTRRSAAIWLMVPPEAPDFERTAIALCDLIVHRDPRIGRLSKPRSPRSQASLKPRNPGSQSNPKPRSPRPDSKHKPANPKPRTSRGQSSLKPRSPKPRSPKAANPKPRSPRPPNR